jgi:hypothetical protein
LVIFAFKNILKNWTHWLFDSEIFKEPKPVVFKHSKNYPTLENPSVLIYYNCLGHLASTLLQSYVKYDHALGNGY